MIIYGTFQEHRDLAQIGPFHEIQELGRARSGVHVAGKGAVADEVQARTEVGCVKD